jgi:ubiquinone/menaquinone biosynthesis C-methylase UbiE
MLKLNLGCGPDKKEGYIGVDKVKLPTVDVVHDLNNFPYPFEDNSVDEIYCSHILEHLDDFNRVMEELWRICKPNALIVIKVPYYKSYLAFSDATHKVWFTEHSFDHFNDSHPLSNFYSKARFKILSKKLIAKRFTKYLPFKSFLNFFLWNIFEEIEFKLLVDKNPNRVPLGDKGVPGERDDILNPQVTNKIDAYTHLQRYKYAARKLKGRILDLGCGTGYGSKLMIDTGKEIKEVYGIDVSSNAINYAEKNHPGPKYICGSAEKIPFPNNYFDGVVAFEVIEHVSNAEKVLEEIHRVLKPNGDLIISTPNPRNLENRIKHFLFKKPYPKKIYEMNIYHLKEFYYEEFLSLLQKRKFKIKSKFGQTLIIFHREIIYLLKRIPFFYRIFVCLGYYFPKYADTIVFWAKKNER